MEYRTNGTLWAFVLAIIGGTLLATGRYVGGAVLVAVAVIVLALTRFARARGDDDRHTLW